VSLHREILKLAGSLSYGMIAEELGTTRSVVAGVIWRAKWNSNACNKATGTSNRNGRKYGRGEYAPVTLYNAHKPLKTNVE